MDALALTPCYSKFLITTDVPKVYMHQFWDSIQKYDTSYRFRMDKKKKFDLNLEIFRDIFQICPRVHGQNFDELPNDEYIVSFFKELGHTREIKSISDVVVDQMHQPWRTFATIINRSLFGKTTGLDKLRLSRVTPPKKARKFKKPASPKLSTVLVSPEEPTRKSKRVKRPTKKSSNVPTTGVVIRDTPVMSLSKKKEKVIVEKRKGIELLSEVALTEEDQYEEVRKKSLRDFYNTLSSSSGTITKISPSTATIKPSVTNEGTCVKPGVPNVTKEESTEKRDNDEDNTQSKNETDKNEMGSKSDQEENEEEVEDDEEEKDEEFVKTPSNSTDDKDETNVEDKVEDDTDEGFIQKEGTDAEMINVQHRNENLEISINQVIEDAHVTISTVLNKIEVPVTRSSHSSDLASKFLNFLDIPHTDAKIISPMDVHVHHELPSNQTPTLLTVPVSVITESSLVYTIVIPQSLPLFTPPPPQLTPTPPPTTKETNHPSALPNFASVFEFND
ncbi:hypothetical protein Tco_1173327 [Tanacetum coccineum]